MSEHLKTYEAKTKLPISDREIIERVKKMAKGFIEYAKKAEPNAKPGYEVGLHHGTADAARICLEFIEELELSE
jgi:hypothetical protein